MSRVNLVDSAKEAFFKRIAYSIYCKGLAVNRLNTADKVVSQS